MTKSVHKRLVRTALVVLFCFLAIAAANLVETRNTSGPTAQIGSGSFRLDVVRTQEDRTKGLSGRSGLAADQAMLFVFEDPGQHCIWMKDMKFSIDIVWLDGAQKVIKIEPRVRPESYPRTYCPSADASYVVELQAGVTDLQRLVPGQSVQLRNL